MRLVELEPRWVSISGRTGMGVSFLCPHCRTERLAVMFKNPVDGGPPDEWPESRLWARTGSTFSDLTLHPSVDASGFGHLHGWIQNGEVR